MPDVYIAEGHGRRPDGTFDPGATDGIHTEQRDSKPVAEACTTVLRNAGLTVISESDMADDPNFYGTTARANAAGVKCVVSFHYDWNQAPPGAFAIWKTAEGRKLGEAIEHRVAEAGFTIRGYPGNPRSLYLLNNSHAPAVIFECGRIGHEDIDETHEQRAMGEAAAFGVLDWLGVDDMMTAEQFEKLIHQAKVGKTGRSVASVLENTMNLTNGLYVDEVLNDEDLDVDALVSQIVDRVGTEGARAIAAKLTDILRG